MVGNGRDNPETINGPDTTYPVPQEPDISYIGIVVKFRHYESIGRLSR